MPFCLRRYTRPKFYGTRLLGTYRPAEQSFSPPKASAPPTIMTKPPLWIGCGSGYYFSLSQPYWEAQNSHLSCTPSLSKVPADSLSSSEDYQKTSGDSTAAGKSAEDCPSSKHQMIRVKGIGRSFTMNTAVAPLSQEELLHWRLDRLLYLNVPVQHNPNAQSPLFLLPPDARVVSLGPQMDGVDQAYRQKGWFTPSEVAQALFKVTPTFYVETRHVIQALSPDVFLRLESIFPRRAWLTVLFGRYPMLFKLRRPRFQRSAVKLNMDMWFVREHPDYQKGDSLHYKHNAEYSAVVGGVVNRSVPTGHALPSSAAIANSPPMENDEACMSMTEEANTRAACHAANQPIDLRIFEILVNNLPRIPAREEAELNKRYEPLPLVKWVNSFAPHELDILNTVPQQRVVTILQEYPLVFQLMCVNGETPLLYMDRSFFSHLFLPDALPGGSGGDVDGRDACNEEGSNDGGPRPTPQAPFAHHGHAPQSHVAALHVSGKEVGDLKSEGNVKERHKQLRQALQDDLLGVDDVASSNNMEGEPRRTLCNLEMDSLHLEEVEGEAGEQDSWEEEEAENDLVYGDRNLSENDSDCLLMHRCENTGKANVAYDNEVTRCAGTVPANLETLYLRRLPPHIAPRSLSNFNQHNTPNKELVKFIASFLAAPPFLKDDPQNFFAQSQLQIQKGDSSEGDGPAGPSPSQPSIYLWRWVPVQRIYTALTPAQRHYLRQTCKGIVNFIRLHGELFELSEDLLHVIAHDPRGTIAPIVPTQTTFHFQQRVVLPADFDDSTHATAALIGEEARRKYADILGRSQIPTTRKQLTLLDPHNPLLFYEVLYEEIAQLLPPDRAVEKNHIMRRLPPIMRVALGRTKLSPTAIHSNKFFTVWVEKGITMMQRKELGVPRALQQPQLNLEDTVEGLCNAIPVGGATIRALIRLHLPDIVVKSLNDHFGSVYAAVKAYPQYFQVFDAEGSQLETLVKILM